MKKRKTSSINDEDPKNNIIQMTTFRYCRKVRTVFLCCPVMFWDPRRRSVWNCEDRKERMPITFTMFSWALHSICKTKVETNYFYRLKALPIIEINWGNLFDFLKLNVPRCFLNVLVLLSLCLKTKTRMVSSTWNLDMTSVIFWKKGN